MKKNEVGRKIAVNIGQDISSASNFMMILAHNKYSIERGPSDGVIRPDVDVTFTPCGEMEPVTYFANQYLYYVTQAGDIPYSGEWEGRSRIDFDSLAESFYGPVIPFYVGD
jgi:hypothetical protein